MLADKAGITHLPLSEYLTHNPARLRFLKAAQNTAVYNLDLLAGPTKREMERAMELEEKAKWCYVHRCYNNIYYREEKKTEAMLNIANLVSKIVPNKYVNEH